MKRLVSAGFLAVVLAALTTSAAVAGGPVTKQNGKSPAFAAFTTICAVTGYLHYGDCNGSTETWAEVKGKINAVQAKTGRYNLGFSFSGLQPGHTYTLWGNRDPATPSPGVTHAFFVVGVVIPGEDGKASFGYQTDDPANLGFDLNRYGVTVVTSYWSEQQLQIRNADGSLYVPQT